MQRRHDPTYYWATRRLPRGDPARHARALRLRAHRRRDRRRAAPRRPPGGAPRRARRLGGRARGRAAPGTRPARGARARRRRPRATACRSASCGSTCARCGSTARRCGSRPGTSSSATWRARPARSGGSWRRCSASPSRTTPASARSASRSSTRTSSATCARTGGSTASTCRPRTRERFGVGEADFDRPAATPELRALVAARGARGRAGCSRAPRARSRPRPPRCGPGIRLACTIYLGVLDRVEALGYDVLGRRPRLPRRGSSRSSRWRRCAR